MSDILEPEEIPEKGFLDLSTAQLIRERQSVIGKDGQPGRSFSKIEIESQRGLQGAPTVEAIAPTPAPLAVAAAPVAPAPAVPVAAPPAPTSDGFSSRANDRINQIWRQKQEANEHAARLEAQLAEQGRRLDALLARDQQRPNPYTNQYNSSPGLDPAQNSPPPAGDFVSRAEMQAYLNQQGQALASILALQTQHTASRTEAERDFPEVFQNQPLRRAYDQILANDPYLQRDPNGPMKAALMARGSFLEQRSAQPQHSADVQKQVLAGLGSTVPQGSAPAVDQEKRYREAMARAAMTNSPHDYALARKIGLGLA